MKRLTSGGRNPIMIFSGSEVIEASGENPIAEPQLSEPRLEGFKDYHDWRYAS
jgi:hypothetical protein